MIIKKIYLENIRSYIQQEIEFPEGSILLSGDIGSGKTTILLGIEFALFGLQPSQKASSILRNGADFGKVKLSFKIQEKQITIERTLKRNKTITQDYASITIDNEKFEGSVTEIKSRVLKLLEYPSEFAKKTNLLYKFTVYTPQEEMKQIILEPDDLRLNTLRHVFGIDKYKKIEENTGIFASRLRERIRINEALVIELENEKQELLKKQEELMLSKEKQHKSLIEYNSALENRLLKQEALKQIQEKINNKRKFESEKEKTNILITEKKQQITTYQNTLNFLQNQISELSSLSFNLESYNSLKERIQFQINKESELQREFISISGHINSVDSRKKDSEELKSKISGLQKCPTCLQEVAEDYKNNIFIKINQELNSAEKHLLDLNSQKKEILFRLEETKKLKEELNQQKSEQEIIKVKLDNLNEKKQRLIDIEKQQEMIKKDIDMLEKHIQSIDISIKEFSIYEDIFKKREEELNEAKRLEDSKAIQKAEINKEIQFLEIQIKEMQEKLIKKQELKQKTEKLKEIEYWITEKFMNLILYTEKQVMIALKEEFSKLFSKWFSILVSDSLSAKLDDNFSPVIEQQDYELDYSFLSGGERTAIALAYRLSLNQVINSLLSKLKTNDLVILDEPTDGFSTQQLDKMRDVLNQLNVKQLIIVSHEQKIEGFVENIIRIKKDSGATKIN